MEDLGRDYKYNKKEKIYLEGNGSLKTYYRFYCGKWQNSDSPNDKWQDTPHDGVPSVIIQHHSSKKTVKDSCCIM